MSYPHYPGKWQYPGWVNPEKMISYMKDRGHLLYDPPESVVLMYSPALAKKIQEQEDVDVRPFMGGRLGLMKSYHQRVAFLSGFGIGGPAVAAKIEELVAFGVKRFISIGTCGALADDLQVGSLVLCHKAIRDEGTSYHYLDPQETAGADPLLIRRLDGELRKQGLNVGQGVAWTIDSPYRETKEEIDHYRQQGVSVVDMESAAVFAAARFRQVPVASLLVVSDLLTSEDWEPRFHVGPVKVGLELAWQVAVGVLT